MVPGAVKYYCSACILVLAALPARQDPPHILLPVLHPEGAANGAGTPQHATRTIDEMLAEVSAVGEPPFDPSRKNEPGYLEKYRRDQHALYRRKAAVLLKACRLHPNDTRIPSLMDRRWVLLGWNQKPGDVAAEVLADIQSVLATNTDELVAAHGAYWKAYYLARLNQDGARKMMECVEPFLTRYPKDERGVQLLALVLDDASADPALRISICRRMATHYSETHFGKYALGMIRQTENVGKPFKLSFNDVMTGRPVSIAALRGKVVVIDFWATTCVPCVAELPHMKELYAKYHERGVEFVGVSLDQPEDAGGLKALRTFIQKHEIPWPQYYQGNGYDSEFSRSWGIGSAPTLFIIDKAGRLHSTEARGRLDRLIPQLLDK